MDELYSAVGDGFGIALGCRPHHELRMVDTDHQPLMCELRGMLECDARAGADLQHSMLGFDLQQRNDPFIAPQVRLAMRHDPRGEPAESTARTLELLHDCLPHEVRLSTSSRSASRHAPSTCVASRIEESDTPTCMRERAFRSSARMP